MTVWRYEARRVGWQALAAPTGAGALAAAMALIAYLANASGTSVDRDLCAAVEVALPLGGALSAVWTVLGDRALEVQLSLPRRYRGVVLGRAALAVLPAGIVGGVAVAVLSGAGRLAGRHDPVSAQLVWLSPLLALSALGLVTAVAARSAAAGTGLVAVAWLMEQVQRRAFTGHAWARSLFLFTTTYQPGQPAWLADRVTLLAVAAGLLAPAWVLLARPQRLLKEDL